MKYLILSSQPYVYIVYVIDKRYEYIRLEFSNKGIFRNAEVFNSLWVVKAGMKIYENIFALNSSTSYPLLGVAKRLYPKIPQLGYRQLKDFSHPH